MMKVNGTMHAHPFVKWVGGKTQLLGEVQNFVFAKEYYIYRALCRGRSRLVLGS